MMLASLLLLAFPLSDSGGLSAVDIHDVQIVPAAVVISDVNLSMLELASLHTVAGFTTKSILAKSIGFPPPMAMFPLFADFPVKGKGETGKCRSVCHEQFLATS
jgi:hypothetical protein